jgi:FHA domain-containing protein
MPCSAWARPAAAIRSLNSATRGSAAAAADELSDLNRPFVAPSTPVTQPRMRAPAPPRPGPVSSAPISPPKAAASAVLSWGDDAGQNRTVIRPKAASPAAGASSFAAAPESHVPPAAAPTPSTANVHAASTSAASADAEALTRALCEGLGLPALPGGPLTPTRMRLIGVLLHEATRGTVELLIARAALKREVRADVTKIVARENNPLKFSPSVEVALNHLLGPTARGFIAPGAAMRDAYDDLRAHQFGFLAGMRAALEGVLKRFDPNVLESKLTQKSLLETLLPSTRKAQMWETFQQLYAQISAEAADDFHELFGKEFLRAYEAHIAELQKDGT